MKTSRLIGAACAVALNVVASASQANLVGVLPATTNGTDYQAYYDDAANLTWLANANDNGVSTWDEATLWAAGLNINGVTGWRLPTTAQPDGSCLTQSGGDSYGPNCHGSEMGNLFYNVLGGEAGQSITTTHNSEYDKFSDIQPAYYWSSTDYAGNANSAWYFEFYNGDQGAYDKTENLGQDGSFYAWAVYPGNAGAVPLPAAIWLFAGGLLGLMGVARQRRR
jgi:hypothetical protein